jgi:dipeptidyl aminopeptidase/acylaminoacyl peptidase
VAGDLLLYANDGALVAQRLDPERGVLEAGPVVLSGAVGIGPLQQLLATAATHGPLVYGDPGAASRELVWSDRAGRAVGTLAGPVTAWDVRIAPTGRRVAVAQLDPQLATLDVWTYDGTAPVPRRLSPALDVDEGPVWAPDAARLAWTSARTALVLRGAEGTLPEERVHRFTQPVRAWDWSPDGRALIVGLRDDTTREDLWMVDLRRPQAPTVCVRSPFNDTFAAVSRDGRWLAYASDESGRYEIYVDTFPVSGARVQVTLGGGAAPRWRQDGQEIVFQRGHALYAVSMATTSSRPVPSDTVKLFDTSAELRAWDMTPDGQRFLLNVPAKSGTAPTVHVVTNWYVHALRQTEAASGAETGRRRRESPR